MGRRIRLPIYRAHCRHPFRRWAREIDLEYVAWHSCIIIAAGWLMLTLVVFR